jgi:RNA-binding protein
LLKVRVRVGDRDARDAVVSSIVERTGAVAVQRIGNVLTLYRRNPDRPKVKLP